MQGGRDPEAMDEGGRTPLHWATGFNANPDVSGRLVELGADVNARGKAGLTPLHTAAIFNANPDVITRLIELGADAAAEAIDGETAWDLAQDNEVLQGTDVWWLLNDSRFK